MSQWLPYTCLKFCQIIRKLKLKDFVVVAGCFKIIYSRVRLFVCLAVSLYLLIRNKLGLTLLTPLVRMRTKTCHGCVRNLSGPYADQNMFRQEMFTYPTGLHEDYLVIYGFVYIREPSSYYFNSLHLLVFHCKYGTKSAKNNSKTDPKWQKSGQTAKYAGNYLFEWIFVRQFWDER